jgi:hypothetical protein
VCVYLRGDRLAVLGRTDVLIKVLGPLSEEVFDSELLEIPVASFDVYVTSKAIAGKTLQEVSDGVAEARGVLLRGMTRGEQSLPIGTGTVLQGGDTLQVLGQRPFDIGAPRADRLVAWRKPKRGSHDPLSVRISDYDQFRTAGFAHSGNRRFPTCAY